MGKDLVALGDYTNIRTGKLDANASSTNGAYPFFTCSKEPLRINSYSYDCECVLVAGNGDLNVKYYSGKFDAYQRTYIIESVNKETLNNKYLFYFLDKYVEILRGQSIGGVIKYIKLGNLTDAMLPLPPLDVQQKIADVLDKASTLIELRKAQLDKLELLVKSQFIEMFGDPIINDKGWPLTTLGDIAEIKTGPFGTLLHKDDYIENGHALVNPSQIIDGKICIDSKLTITKEKYEDLSSYKLQIGDVVLGRRGEMGRCAVVHEDGLLCGTGSMIIRPSKLVKPYFLQNIISNPTFRKEIESNAVGVTMMNLNVAIVSRLPIPLLPIGLQEQFIAFLEQVDKSKFALQQSLSMLEQNYKSLMQRCFEGEIF